MMTAVEFTFNPTDAIKMAHARIQRLAPVKDMLFLTLHNVFCLSSSPLRRLKRVFKNVLIAIFNFKTSIQRSVCNMLTCNQHQLLQVLNYTDPLISKDKKDEDMHMTE